MYKKPKIVTLAILATFMAWMGSVNAYHYPYKPEEKCFKDESIKRPDKSLLRALEQGYMDCPFAPKVDEQKYHNEIILPPVAVKRYLNRKYDFADIFYKQYKIVGERKGPVIDGYETIQYHVEFLYVLLDVSLSGMGEVFDKNDVLIKVIKPKELVVPLCEKTSAWITIGRTPWGWFKLNDVNIGKNLDYWIESQLAWEMKEINQPWGKDSLAIFNKKKNRYLALVERCKKTL